VIEKSLAGPIGVFVKFSTLQEYGVDKVFFLENNNVDTSQRNIIFLARGEKATQPMAIAGTSEIITCLLPCYVKLLFYSPELHSSTIQYLHSLGGNMGSQSRLRRFLPTLLSQS
jgi:hypothetical protein